MLMIASIELCFHALFVYVVLYQVIGSEVT